jgi:hypothetical protein
VATGSIRVTLAGNGPFPFHVLLNPSITRTSIGSADVVFTGLVPNTYTVYLGHQNCAVVDANPKSVVVTEAAQTDVAFTVQCEKGQIVVTTTTAGENMPSFHSIYVTGQNDPWCYDFSCETQGARPNDAITFESRYRLPHLVWLLNLPPNCTATPSSYEGVTPDSAVAFAIACK